MCCFFSNDQTRKSRNEEEAWKFWRVRCSVYAQVCAARAGYKWQWTRGPDTSRWSASSAVISQESYECTVHKCCRYLWIGCTNTPISIWGRNFSMLCLHFRVLACISCMHDTTVNSKQNHAKLQLARLRKTESLQLHVFLVIKNEAVSLAVFRSDC